MLESFRLRMFQPKRSQPRQARSIDACHAIAPVSKRQSVARRGGGRWLTVIDHELAVAAEELAAPRRRRAWGRPRRGWWGGRRGGPGEAEEYRDVAVACKDNGQF